MSFKFSDALKLSWSNIAQHKKRSATIILTISLLFGVIMGFNFISSGIEQTALTTSAASTDGEIYVGVTYTYGQSGPAFSLGNSIEPEELADLDLSPTLDQFADQEIRTRAAEHNGEIVGYTWNYALDYPYRVITKSAVEPFIDGDLWASLPEDKVPAIMPLGWQPPSSLNDAGLADRLGDTLYRVGTFPNTDSGSPVLDGANPLNLVLDQLPSATNDTFWLVDDGSGKVLQYIKDQIAARLANGGWYARTTIPQVAVVKFSNPADMVAFSSPDQQILGLKLYSSDFPYDTQDLFGTTRTIDGSFNSWRALLLAIETLLLIIATLVAIIAFAHLIDQDAPTIALYRAMGASTANIYLIYFLYLLELCLLAIITTILIAFAFIAILAVTSSAPLATSLQDFYNLSILPEITLFTFNSAFWIIIIVILLIAPLALLSTLSRFSAKHIAKKLKED